ncbi:uncharacterized protein LOC109809344 [Cajanus cajan]|uniref:Uncharacterized protein n=1 Tax=Cajanus cajan TaxID=3821 RepID=A0A151SK94_CAJCA|nr:uncharacterized protein LOC109809344 [Cajanus cajan]KYP55217.1 hypothetical protein KK1_001424 [Cajanus cajan]
MSTKSPVFPISDPQHFSDYGFDPQINYFQVLEEAMKHKRDTARSIDSIHFKLQKPISKDESRAKAHKAKKKRWWRTALLFFKCRWAHPRHPDDVHQARARAFRASVSGPVYWTETRSGSSTPYRTTTRPSSGPLAGTLTKDDVDTPYLSLRELNMEQQQQQQQQRRMSTSAMPIYLVT